MRAPVTGAVLCAIAAVALLVAGFTPWFSTGKEIDYRMAYERQQADLDSFEEDRARADEADVRANFGLVTGEVCIDLQCKSAKYTGSPGLADDAFAWLGRGALGAAMASVALLIAVALAARTHRRAHLRGWAATVAAVAAGLGAAFAASWAFNENVGYVSRGMGLTAAMAGAAFAGLGVGWPAARGNVGVAKRFGIAAVIAVLAVLAWVTMVEHAWWRSGRALGEIQVSPLGVEVCEAGTCKLATTLGVTGSLRALAALTALASAVLLVPAFATAGRVARGVRPGAWGWAAMIVGVCALGAGAATFVAYPSSDIMHVAWGLPLFAVATAGATAASLAGLVLVKDADADAFASPHAYRHEPAFATSPNGAIALAPGERPQLAALAPLAPSGANGGPAPAGSNGSPATAASRYAPSSAVAAAAFEAATGRVYAPAVASELAHATPAETEPEPEPEPEAETETETETETGPGPGPGPGTATVVEPLVIHVADAASAAAPSPNATPSPFAPPPPATPSPFLLPAAPSPFAPPASSPYAPPSPSAPRAAAPAAIAGEPGSAPVGVPVVVRPQPTAPTTPIRKSPMCPTCRVATIYSSKRGAWWCSTCKRTL
ncbi:MAG TPA: hypothetical protein VM261_09975 [Kofleriaceae bacterium]|nr:hypothetical protein [Kofleriaceae bacterium]